MNKKLSFVTNSSSTSFCIIGIRGYIFDSKESEFFETIGINYDNDFKVNDFINSLSEKTNLDVYYGGDGEFFIGLHLGKANPNKPINKLIIDVRNSLKTLCFTDECLNNVDIISETIAD